MAETKDDTVRYRAPALDKGLDILELLAASSVALTQAEIAKGLNRGPNEIYRMLDTLVRRGYVTRSPEGDRFLLSLRLLVLADMHPPRRRLLDTAEPLMRLFAEKAEQSIHLAVLEEGDVVISSSFSAPGNWQLSLRIGAVVGLFNTGSGLVLAAFQSRQTRAKLMGLHRPVAGETIPDAKLFEETAAGIRACGHFIGQSQTAGGVDNFSFPILDPLGNAVAVLTCPYLRRIDAHTTPERERIISLLAEIAAEVSSQLFGPPAQTEAD
ncbi:IclR family transcriptional regulator [Thioclava sp. A2]|uniref:IclR family transcriptional regulator n=1 Tax=Thioclava sp. FCG-A2 TaxID=3080562 RepID=UPI002953AF20|nr:IclR family transcriptional regulator [Thioclava sp. A2]MDV7271615.1 IclR family transcriptional regulator [Thioclava sp. A2]